MDFRSLIGKKFGSLTILDVVFREETNKSYMSRRTYLRCKCDCGTILDVNAYSVTSGRTTSCGCSKRKHPEAFATSRRFPREYSSWNSMRQRCLNPKEKHYKYYGGRGITICDRWLDPQYGFENFLLDMGDRPENTTLDRIEPFGNYEPENCQWATLEEQESNKTNTVRIPFGDEFLTLNEAADKLGINRATLQSRYYALGDKPLDAILYPGLLTSERQDRASNELEFNGETKTLKEWSELVGVEVSTLVKRMEAGWDTERVLTTPKSNRTAANAIKSKVVEYDGKSMTLGEWADYLGKDYSVIKARYVSDMPLDKVFSPEVFSKGHNTIRGDKYQDYVGQKFGSLTIVSIIRKKSTSGLRIYAVCDCDCGIKNKEVLLTNLTGNKQTSCGMCPKKKQFSRSSEDITNSTGKLDYKLKDIIGKRFHRLVVEDWFTERAKSGNLMYKLRCKCDCGEETIIMLSNWGRVKSCGCFKEEASMDPVTKKHYDSFVSFKRQQDLKKLFPSLPLVESSFTGMKFNKLYIEEVRRYNDKSIARCRCDCGGITIKDLANVTTGHTKSCGCSKRGPRKEDPQDNSTITTKACFIGEKIGPYTVLDLYRQSKNIYAKCYDEVTDSEKNIRTTEIKKIKERLQSV